MAGAIVETARLRLRPFEAGDLDGYNAVRGKPAVARFLPSFRGADEAEVRAKTVAALAAFAAHWSEHGYGPWAVIEQASGRLLGHCGLRHLPEHRDTEILYALDDAVWGRGYAFEAASAARDHGFRQLGLGRLIALVLPENRASIRVIEKLGLRPDGTAQFLGNTVLRYAMARPAA